MLGSVASQGTLKFFYGGFENTAENYRTGSLNWTIDRCIPKTEPLWLMWNPNHSNGVAQIHPEFSATEREFSNIQRPFILSFGKMPESNETPICISPPRHTTKPQDGAMTVKAAK